MTIEKYGVNPLSANCNETPARVTAVHRDFYEIVCEQGTGLAKLKKGEYYNDCQSYPVTGDFVLIDWQKDAHSRIVKTLPRKTYFSRLDPSSSGRGEQAVASNFDYVFIMQALDNDFNPRRLERYLTLAWQSGAIPIVVLTKADGVEDYTTHLRAAEKMTASSGAAVFPISAKTGQGIAELADYLKPGKTIVLLGSSGVGKSTLVNALAGRDIMTTGGIREKDSKGKHTTSHRQLILLDSGVMIIDTPGMRELGMWDISEGLEQSFSDVEEHLGSCRFSDCKHQSEPGCAIKKAIQNGELSQSRWESYNKLKGEARYSDNKAEYMKNKKQRHKSINKLQRQKREVDYRIEPCNESFICSVCGASVSPEAAGSSHRNHCPHCLASLHLDIQPGDRASLCKGIMDAIGIWVRKNGEWAIIHRCRSCGELCSNRIASDDNSTLLMSIAVKPLAAPPFPLWANEVYGATSDNTHL